MSITLNQFENNVSKYLKMALIMDITVVDLEGGRSWIITRGAFQETHPVWVELCSALLQKRNIATAGGDYA